MNFTRKKYYLFIILCSCTVLGNLTAQEKTKYFQLSAPAKKLTKSNYNSVKFIDNREDTTNFGIVRIGALNKEAAVVTPIGIGEQLNQLLFELNPENSGKGEILFQLRKLKFIEKAEGLKEFGYCFFRANMYTYSGDKYRQIAIIDTFLTVESRDVTKLIFEKTDKAIVKFFLSSLEKDTANTTAYTREEIANIDEVEKQKIKLYNVDVLTDGIYSTFQTFRDQTPDFTLFSITFEDGEISEIKARNKNGKVKKMKSDNVYAIVNKGKAYISAEFGFYPLVKNNNDFYFIGDDKQHYIKGQIVKSHSLLDPTEYVYSPLPLTSQYEIKVDHLNGKFMRVKEIKE
ncbi:MAG: hypothetical protein JNM96_06490 [Bacteroidia bacterium]|nr:hypothetical protein [Bacteroidia bacterium]